MSRVAVVPLAVAAAALALAGCGGSGHHGRLAWKGRPLSFSPKLLPHDHVLSGTVENTGSAPLALHALKVRVLDARGRPLRSSAVFLQSFLHGLAFPDEHPLGTEGRPEQERIGLLRLLAPGRTMAFTVSWRQPPGAAKAARIEYGAGSLPVP